MEPYWDRFTWNLKNLFNFKDGNPWVLAGEGDLRPKKRIAILDIGHSLKNLFVEGGRVYLGLGKEKAIDDANKPS